MSGKKRKRKLQEKWAAYYDGSAYQAIERGLGVDPRSLAIASQSIASYDLPNLHHAVERTLAELGGPISSIGVVSDSEYRPPSTATITQPRLAREFSVGPIDRQRLETLDGRSLLVPVNIVHFINDDPRDQRSRAAILVARCGFPGHESLNLGVLAPAPERAQSLLALLHNRARERVTFRGQAFSVDADCHGRLTIQRRVTPVVMRNDLILPESVKDRIERHTLRFGRHAERLRATGRHLRRGLLLYGPPGNGKTLASMYVCSQLPGRTTIVVEAGGLQALDATCGLARDLAPATVVIEDIDLVASRREEQMLGANAVLSRLLDHMDGLREDADVLFLLTTNRAEHLEPALAARPGRIDEAIEIPLPDADCRSALFALYAKGLEHRIDNWKSAVAASESVSAALIKESLRRAALIAYDADKNIVEEAHLTQALRELAEPGNIAARLNGSSSFASEMRRRLGQGDS